MALGLPFNPAGAQLTVQILKGMAESVPIAIVPLAWDGAGPPPYDVAATVHADLERSGRFRPLPRAQIVEQPHAASEVDVADWRMLKIDYVLVGRLAAMPDGRYEVRYELVSVANGERLLGTAVPVDPKALKRASHRISDAVYERILGVRGAFATRIAYVAVEGPGEPAQLPPHRLGCRRRQRAHRVRFARPDHVAVMVARRKIDRLCVVPQRAVGGLRADPRDRGAGAGLGQVRHQWRAGVLAGRVAARARAVAEGRQRRRLCADAGVAGPQARHRRRLHRHRAGLGAGRALAVFHVGSRRRPAGVPGRDRARRARAARDLRGRLQRAPAPVARRAPPCGRHAGPRCLPDRHRRRQAGRHAGAQLRPAGRVPFIRAERGGHPVHQPHRRARHARDRVERRPDPAAGCVERRRTARGRLVAVS